MKRFQNSSRRQFLAQSARAGGVLALPHFASLDGANAAASATAPRRLVVIHPHLGFYPHEFYPTKTGLRFDAPRLLKALEPFRGNYTLFNGLDHPDMTGGHAVTSTLLSGENYKLRPSKRHGISLDQYIASHIGGETRFDKLVLAVGGGEATTVSFDQNGTPFPDRINSPLELYNRLFVTDPKAQARLRDQVEADRSILDGLRSETKTLENRLGPGDRERLDHYLTAVRDLEARMAKDIKWAGIGKPEPPDGFPQPKVTGRGMHAAMPALFEAAALALQTDSTRVMSIAIGAGTPEIEGIEFSATYHQLSHHGKIPEKIEQLLAIEEATMVQIARFLTKLQETKDTGGRPLLDNTTVLLSSGIGNAHSHSNQHLPALVVGGGYRHRGYIDLRDKDIPLCNLFVDFAQRMGVDCEKFATSTGGFTELS